MVLKSMASSSKPIRQCLDFVKIVRHGQRATTNSLLESKLHEAGMSFSGKMVLELCPDCMSSFETKDLAKSRRGQGRQQPALESLI